MKSTSNRQVLCPECGQGFSSRGLSGHRRLRHGSEPAAALPREVCGSLEALPAILSAVVGLQDAVERLVRRLAAGAPALRETPIEEAARLERELADLLQHIVRLKQTGLAWTTIRPPASEAEERATLELAGLRRDQARLVFRLEELRSGKPSDERFLT